MNPDTINETIEEAYERMKKDRDIWREQAQFLQQELNEERSKRNSMMVNLNRILVSD